MILLTWQIVNAQDQIKLVTKDTVITPVKTASKAERRWGDGGIGIGIDYGGLFGVKATFYPIKYMGVFVAGGWELIGIGWNVGCLGRFVPADGQHGVRPYLKVMYGVNAMMRVTGKSGYDKMFYGVTAGIGLETRFGKTKKSGINLDLNVPFRSPEYFSQLNQLKNDPEVKLNNTPLPITISIGYNVEF